MTVVSRGPNAKAVIINKHKKSRLVLSKTGFFYDKFSILIEQVPYAKLNIVSRRHTKIIPECSCRDIALYCL